jgi:hypothetical protein
VKEITAANKTVASSGFLRLALRITVLYDVLFAEEHFYSERKT